MATRIQEDAPHPDSYRPDLPLRGELNTLSALERARREGYSTGYQRGYEKGSADEFDDGAESGKEEGLTKQAARGRELETENAQLREKIAKSA